MSKKLLSIRVKGNNEDWGFNDYKMSKLTDIERSKLSKFRTGDRKNPTYDDGIAIMEVYKREARKHS